MIKKLTLRFAVMMAVIMATLSASAVDFTDGVFSFDIISEEEATVKIVKTATTTDDELYIPSTTTYNGKTYTVTVIGEYGIYQLRAANLAIYIPTSIKEIEDYGICACYYLYWLEIEPSDEPLLLGKNVLNSCSKLEYALIGRQLTYKDGVSNTNRPFMRKNEMYAVDIRGGYHNINDFEFAHCDKLQQISLNTPIYSIGEHAFYNSKIFRYINDYGYQTTGTDYWSTIDSIGEYAFAQSGFVNFVVPANVKNIPGGMLNNCSNLKNIYFREEIENVESIGRIAFSNCPLLETLQIPGSVQTIGTSFCDGCTSLKKVEFLSGNTPLLFDASTKKSLFFKDAPIEEIIVGRSLTYNLDYGLSPFSQNTNLKKVVIGDNCLDIPTYCFYECTSLESINWGNGIQSIGINAFSKCSNIGSESTRFPQTLKKIDIGAFTHCSNIEYIWLAEGLECIGSSAFSDTGIRVLNIPSTVTTIDLSAFSDCPNLNSVFFESGSDPLAFGWTVFQNSPVTNLTLGRTILPYGETDGKYGTSSTYGFKDNKTIETLYIAPGCEVIQSSAFANCSNLKTVIFTYTPTCEKIESSAFYNCPLLTEITIPGCVTEIGNWALSATGIKNVNFAQSEEPLKIGNGGSKKSFFNDVPIEYVSICRPLSYEISAANGYSPFVGNQTLKSVYISEAISEIPDFMFQNCSALTEISLPEVSKIGLYAFYNCNSFTRLIFGDKLQTIGELAFYNCPINYISSLSVNAPQIEDGITVFDETIFSSALLKVPEHSDAVQSYLHANVWKNFYNIAPQTSDDLFVHSIALGASQVTLKPTETMQLTATVLPEIAGNKVLNWTSSDENVVSVTNDGKITALKSGVSTITATATDGTGLSISCDVAVSLQVADIVLNESEATLNEGQTVQLTATVSPELADNKTLQWTSSNEAVATVDQSGLVTAVAQGNAIITVSSTDGSDVAANCNITVVRPVSSISLSETEIVMSAGEYRILTATAIPRDATNKTLVWTSSNEAVARVENGIVVAIADGEATVIVSAVDGSDASASCHVIVRTLVTEIILSENNLSLKEREFKEISATVLPNDATNAEVIWASSDESVATVQNGLILAHKLGTAIIRVEATDDSGVYAECTVEVTHDAGIVDVTADGVYITTESLIATVHGTNEDTIIRLFDMGGKVLYIGNNPRVEVAHHGFYILVVNNKIFKIEL